MFCLGRLRMRGVGSWPNGSRCFCFLLGIFTIYYSHMLWIWNDVIAWIFPAPIDIFLICFETPPEIIIYDDSCKLHQYVLIQHPTYFKNTSFIDRFHWQGHVGCFSGYWLDRYATPLITSINSQVNEQANAGLQHIKGQIVYMKPDSFMF